MLSDQTSKQAQEISRELYQLGIPDQAITEFLLTQIPEMTQAEATSFVSTANFGLTDV